MALRGGASKASGSQGWKAANEIFKAGCNASLAPCLRMSKFQKATALYHQALRNATGRNLDLAIIHKNLGSTHWRCAELVQEDGDKDVMNFHIKQGCHHYLAALSYGSDFQPEDWLAGVHKLLTKNVTTALALFQEWDQVTRRSCLRQLSTAMSEASGVCEAASECKYKLAKQLYWEGIRLLEAVDKDRMEAATRGASLMNEASQLLVEAMQRGTEEQRSEVEVSMEEVFLYQCTCESIQASYQGNALLDSLLKTQEHLDMDFVWLAIDKYKQAAVLARERDLEAEGSALSRLGHVYKGVLKMEKTAHTYYFKAAELALTFSPGRMGKMAWAQEAIKEVGEHQERVRREEAAKEEQERGPWLETLKDELTALQRAVAGSAEAFLKHLYEKHPPKNPDHKLGPLNKDPDVTKKALLRAISHYHTDKNLAAKHGKKWEVLCGEITRFLNSKYTYYK
eukprot:TRINITY_DN14649_c0_g1_i1.p1 TRINITY_DN14649_c0_g1~~TRINITY_DN14649_c0_g1_i1.p1  ORF type:complete len:454 (+),score=119.84 TRINITY_DN14649_c0_g1_i1:200-1561(+)